MHDSPLILIFVLTVLCGLVAASLPLFALLLPQPRLRSRMLFLAVVVVAFCVVGFMAFIGDIAGAGGNFPFLGPLLALAFPVLVTAGTLAAARRHHSLAGAVLAAIFLGAVVVMHFSDTTPVKPYRRFFAAVHNGMSQTDVLAALHAQFPQAGPYKLPAFHNENGDLCFNLDLTDDRYNAESVVVEMYNGRVIGKSYAVD